MLREIWNARNLLLNLVRRDLTIRYRSTVLGFFWSFLKPLFLTGILWLVFQYFLGMRLAEPAVPFTLHLLVGVLCWTFFAGAAGDSMSVVISNANLIKKVKLPLMVFPLAAAISHFIHFLLALLVLFIISIFSGLPPTWAYLIVPLVSALLFVMTLALCLVLSSLNVFYRDISSIWELLSQIWFYATPIVYPVYMATEKLSTLGWNWAKWLYLANPLTPAVIALRRLLLYASVGSISGSDAKLEMPDSELAIALAVCAVLTFALFFVSKAIFLHFSRKFADEL